MDKDTKIVLIIGVVLVLVFALHQTLVPATTQKITLVPQQQADLQAAQTALAAQQATGVAVSATQAQANDQISALAAQNALLQSQTDQTNAIANGLSNIFSNINGS